MEKGGSQLAGERENIESKLKATVRLIEAQEEELFPSMRKEGSPWFLSSLIISVFHTEIISELILKASKLFLDK
jgi:hypothetical protein